jgi:DNA-binding transcriptional ArsR family regulator
MEDPTIEKTKVENIVKEVGREQDSLIEEMKSSYFMNNLVKQISSTIHGSPKNYGLDCLRFIISSHSPKIPITDLETKITRFVRGSEAHLLTGLPGTAKSSWYAVIENQGLNVVKTQIATQGGILGTVVDQGLTEFLKFSVWLLPEAEYCLNNPTIVNILRSLIEEQELGKTSAYVVSKTRLLKIHSAVSLSLVFLPKASKEFQLLSRLYMVKFEYETFEEVFNIGEKLTENLMSLPKTTESFEPEPRHYLGLIANKIVELGLKENRFFCTLSQEHKKELYNTWKNLITENYGSKIPKGISLRDLTEGFRSTQNYGLLNLFQRDVVKQGSYNILQLTEEDLKHGLKFMEEVIKSRSEYGTEEMKETKFRIPLKTIVQIYELYKQGLSLRQIADKVNLSHPTVSRYLKEMGVESE